MRVVGVRELLVVDDVVDFGVAVVVVENDCALNGAAETVQVLPPACGGVRLSNVGLVADCSAVFVVAVVVAVGGCCIVLFPAMAVVAVVVVVVVVVGGDRVAVEQ